MACGLVGHSGTPLICDDLIHTVSNKKDTHPHIKYVDHAALCTVKAGRQAVLPS